MKKERARLAIVVFSAMCLFGCTGQRALEKRYSLAELNDLLDQPAQECEGPKCAKKQEQERAEIKGAIRRIEMDELKSAPACLQAHKASKAVAIANGVDPDSPDVTAWLAIKGFTLTVPAECAAQVCEWQKKYEPLEISPYCAQGAAAEPPEDGLKDSDNPSIPVS